VDYEGYKKFRRDGLEDALRIKEDRIKKDVDANLNETTGTLLTVKWGDGQDAVPVRVKKGLMLKEDGTIDYGNSSNEVYIVDGNGETHVVSANVLSDVIENTGRDEAAARIVSQIRNRVEMTERMRDMAEEQNLNLNDKVYIDPLGNGIADEVTVTRINDDGTYDVTDRNGNVQKNISPELVKLKDGKFRPIAGEDEVVYMKDGKRVTGRVTDASGMQDAGYISIGDDTVPVTDVVGRTGQEGGNAGTQSAQRAQNDTKEGVGTEGTEGTVGTLGTGGTPGTDEGHVPSLPIDEKAMTDDQKLQYLEQKRGKDFALAAARKAQKNTDEEIRRLQKKFDRESDLLKLDRIQDQIDLLAERNKVYGDYINAAGQAVTNENVPGESPNVIVEDRPDNESDMAKVS
jgi:hypothetical protein